MEKLTLHSAVRIMRAIFFTPGRQASQAANDPICARLVEEADEAWTAWHTERYERAPTDEEHFYRQVASTIDWGMPILALGKPGTAKTKVGETLCRQAGLLANTIVGSQEQPEDVGGYPVPNRTRTAIEKLPSPWVDRISSAINGAGQVFDELTTADEAMEAAMLRVFSDKVAGQRRLPPRTRVIAFGNRVGEVAQARDLTAASANRFVHLEWDGPSEREWTEWVASSMDIDLLAVLRTKSLAAKVTPDAEDPNVEEMRVLKAWPEALLWAKGVVASYVQARGQVALHDMPTANSDQQSKGWASHRSNENLIRALAGSRVHGLSEQETLVWAGGLIGSASAVELAAHMGNVKIPNTEAVLDGKSDWQPDSRLDVSTAVMFNAASMIATAPYDADNPDKLWIKRASRFWTLASQVCDHGHSDAIAAAGRAVMRAGYRNKVCPEARPVTVRMEPYIKLGV